MEEGALVWIYVAVKIDRKGLPAPVQNVLLHVAQKEYAQVRIGATAYQDTLVLIAKIQHVFSTAVTVESVLLLIHVN
eukprot:5877086-Ditylum_brightwellii.AAC.1